MVAIKASIVCSLPCVFCVHSIVVLCSSIHGTSRVEVGGWVGGCRGHRTTSTVRPLHLRCGLSLLREQARVVGPRASILPVCAWHPTAEALRVQTWFYMGSTEPSPQFQSAPREIDR